MCVVMRYMSTICGNKQLFNDKTLNHKDVFQMECSIAFVHQALTCQYHLLYCNLYIVFQWKVIVNLNYVIIIFFYVIWLTSHREACFLVIDLSFTLPYRFI